MSEPVESKRERYNRLNRESYHKNRTPKSLEKQRRYTREYRIKNKFNPDYIENRKQQGKRQTNKNRDRKQHILDLLGGTPFY